MADRLINDLTELTSGNVEGGDFLEIQEDDAGVTKKIQVTTVTELEAAARATQDDVIEAGVGLDTDGTYPGFSGSNYLDSTTDVMDALDALDSAISGSGSGIVVDIVQVTAANFNGSGTVPYDIIAAPGANKFIELLDCSIWLDYKGVAPTWAAGSPKPVLEYAGAASHFMEWSNAFITSTSDTANKGTWTSEVTMELNTAIQLSIDTGINALGGTTALKFWVTYIIRDNTAS